VNNTHVLVCLLYVQFILLVPWLVFFFFFWEKKKKREKKGPWSYLMKVLNKPKLLLPSHRCLLFVITVSIICDSTQYTKHGDSVRNLVALSRHTVGQRDDAMLCIATAGDYKGAEGWRNLSQPDRGVSLTGPAITFAAWSSRDTLRPGLCLSFAKT
jgi:hypothetical protein